MWVWNCADMMGLAEIRTRALDIARRGQVEFALPHHLFLCALRRRIVEDSRIPKVFRIPLQIDNLPLEMRARIVEHVDMSTRLGLWKTSKVLAEAEAVARYDIDELLLYRTADTEMTMCCKFKGVRKCFFWKCQAGNAVEKWTDSSPISRKDMRRKARLTPFGRSETPLGEVEQYFENLLARSHITMLKIDGLHVSDDALPQLSSLLAGKSITHLAIIASSSSTSDAPLYSVLLSMPSTKSLRLHIHCTIPKKKVVDRLWLRQATSQLQRLCIFSRPLGSSRLSEESTDVNDEFLIRLLSGTCVCLQLLFFSPLLSAHGVESAIEHLLARCHPHSGFIVHIKSTEALRLLRLLTLIVDAAGIVSSPNPSIEVDQSPQEIVTTFNRKMFRVTVDCLPSTLPLTPYTKVTVETTTTVFLPTLFDN